MSLYSTKGYTRNIGHGYHNVQDSQGNLQDCRILLDGGSQFHFIIQRFCEQLNLKLIAINQLISGLGNQQTNLNRKTEIIFKLKYNAYGAKITCLVIQNITEDMPNVIVDKLMLKIPKNLKLADPQFHQSRPIDLLELNNSGIFYTLVRYR